METARRTAYEIREGRLLIDGRPLPLGKGLILLALAKAGWNGAEGPLDAGLAQRALSADPRLGMLLPPRARAG
jgi:hypothetical protein